MASHEKTLDDLRILLLTKFYPMKIDLIRNDQATAKLVAEYVAVMTRTYNATSRKSSQKWTNFQWEAVSNHSKIESLSNLTTDTLRKYIAELWAERAFRDYLKIEDVKDL